MKTRFTLIAALIAIMSVCISGCSAQQRERVVSLNGDWNFNLGDNIKYARPEYDDTDWEKIHVPSTWAREGFRNYHGYAWYRKMVTIKSDASDALYIELGRIDDVDEVYLNGHLIGKTGGFPPDYYTAWNYERRYFLPEEHINKNGRNVIAIRVFDEGGEGGILGDEIGIYNIENYSANSFHLFGRWKFNLSDDKEWASETYNDSAWDTITVPGSWESQGFRHYDGFAWYRKSFRLPDNFKTSDLTLIAGKIDDMDEVYINGRLVGNTGKMDRKWAGNDEYQRLRTYNIPDGLLKPGKYNMIAVRVYDQEGDGGIYEGPVTILPENEYREFWRSYRNNTYYGSGSFMRWLSYYID